MRILVTGGGGFIGSHLVEKLLPAGHAALIIENFATGRCDHLQGAKGAVELIEATIADPKVVNEAFDRFQPEIVLHCAASYKDPDNWLEDVQTNVLGTVNLVKAAVRTQVRRFIYFQTALCYGNYPREQPVTLTHPLNPENSYAISKTAGERYIATSGLEFLSFRLANVYGPRNVSGPIPTFFSRLSNGKKCFTVDTRRDFIFVEDMVQVVLRAVEGKGRSGYYHIASGLDCSIRDLYDAVAGAMGINQTPEERKRGEDDTPTILLDAARTVQDFNWEPTTPLREGIARTIAWYRTHGVEQTFTHLRALD